MFVYNTTSTSVFGIYILCLKYKFCFSVCLVYWIFDASFTSMVVWFRSSIYMVYGTSSTSVLVWSSSQLSTLGLVYWVYSTSSTSWLVCYIV